MNETLESETAGAAPSAKALLSRGCGDPISAAFGLGQEGTFNEEAWKGCLFPDSFSRRKIIA